VDRLVILGEVIVALAILKDFFEFKWPLIVSLFYPTAQKLVILEKSVLLLK